MSKKILKIEDIVKSCWLIIENVISSGIPFLLDLTKICTMPFALVFSYWTQLVEYYCDIVVAIVHAPLKLLNLIPLTIQVWFWGTVNVLMYWCDLRDGKKAQEITEKKIYEKLKTILQTIYVLPLSGDMEYSLFTLLETVDGLIFGEGGLPFPYFLFTKIKPVKDSQQKIHLAIPDAYEDPHSESEIESQSTKEPLEETSTSPSTSDHEKETLNDIEPSHS